MDFKGAPQPPCLLFDVLTDDGDECAAATSPKVGRRPQRAAPHLRRIAPPCLATSAMNCFGTMQDGQAPRPAPRRACLVLPPRRSCALPCTEPTYRPARRWPLTGRLALANGARRHGARQTNALEPLRRSTRQLLSEGLAVIVEQAPGCVGLGVLCRDHGAGIKTGAGRA